MNVKGDLKEFYSRYFSLNRIRSSTTTLPFSKPFRAQTLHSNNPIESNEIHDLLVWYEIFELSPNGE